MLPIVRTERARLDLEEIFARLEELSPAAADRLAALIDRRCDLLAQFPYMGPSREDLARELRHLVVGKYLLFYRVREDHIEIVRILYGARDLGSLFDDET